MQIQKVEGRDAGTPSPHRPAMLNMLLAARACKVGNLIAFAKGLPIEWAVPVASGLTEAITKKCRTRQERLARRRQLVILLALLARIAIEEEKISQDPDALI